MSCENISGWKQELLSNNRSFPFAAILWFPVQKYEDSEIVLHSLHRSSGLEKDG